MQKPTCTIPECSKPVDSRGLCSMHYVRMSRAGTLPPKPTPERRFWAKVDKSGDCWEWTAFLDTDGYGKFGFDGRSQYAHRVAYILEHGTIPAGYQVDHMCHNRKCVRPLHLQSVLPKHNSENRAADRLTGMSGVRGVHWRKDAKRWQAIVKHAGRNIHVGYFRDLAEAEAAAVAKRNELYVNNLVDRAIS